MSSFPWGSVVVALKGALALGLVVSAHAAESTPAARKHPRPNRAVPPMLENAQRERLTNEKRDEAIEQLKRIMAKVDDRTTGKADLLYELSEFYWEKSKSLERQEVAKYEAVYQQYQAARGRGERAEKPNEDHAQSELFRLEAMRLYEIILRDYPRYERTDEVLFALGYNLYDTGKTGPAVERYQQLIREHPRSRFLPDTYLQLGNHYFDVQNDLTRARQYYQKALSSDAPKIHSYALYKLAWCDYNAGDLEGSLKRLKQVVDYAETRGSEMVDLKNEALGDLVLIFVQIDRSEEGISYFRRKAPSERQAKLIARLGERVAEAGHHEKAIKIYHHLLEQTPNDPDAPQFQQAIVRSYEGLRQRGKVRDEVQRLAMLYHPDSAWWKANARTAATLRNAFQVSEEAMRNLVTEYHQEAQKTKQVETYRLARDIYKQYVDSFATSEDPERVSDHAFNLRFYYAEILWALEEWENAALQYEAVIDFKIPARQSAQEVSDQKYRERAAYDAVLAYDKLVKIERGLLAPSHLSGRQTVDEQKGKGKVASASLNTAKEQRRSASAQPLSAQEKKLIAACDKYNDLFPNNPNEIDLRYQAAVVFYDRRQDAEAVRRFGEVILKWPEERRSQQAADLSMHLLEGDGDWVALSQLSRKFLENTKLSKPGSEFANRVQRVAEGSHYKWIDEVIHRKDKNPTKAAEEFTAFAAQYPKSVNAARALTATMLLFGEIHRLDRGIEVGERVLRDHPGSPLRLKAQLTLGRYYEKTAQFRKAAQAYESFVAAYDRIADRVAGDQDIRRKAISTRAGEAASSLGAATPSGEEGLPNEAKERKELLAEAAKLLPDALFDAGVWWDALGETDRAVQAYGQYVARFPHHTDVPDVELKMASAYEKAKRWKDAARIYEGLQKNHTMRRAEAAKRYWTRYRQALAYQNAGRLSDAEKLTGQLLWEYPRLSAGDSKNERARSAYAHLRFLKLEPLWRAYAAVKFARASTIRSDLELKRRKLAELEKEYVKVLALGIGDYGIASLTRIGLAYADLAENIISSADPRGLNPDQLEMYRGELQNLASPLEQKASEAFEKALAKAYELSVYDDWTLLAQEKLEKSHPGQYQTARQVAYVGSESFQTAPIQKELGAKTQAGGFAAKVAPPANQVRP
jgi:tetratricopeptide (TPR) repeat protein